MNSSQIVVLLVGPLLVGFLISLCVRELLASYRLLKALNNV